MGFLSRFEGKMEDAVESAAGSLSRSPISPVQITKKCERQMMRSKMVGSGKEYAPTLYTVLVNGDDDQRLFSFYPTLSGEVETYLSAAATRQGLYMDGSPLVRFIVDSNLNRGRFDVIAEVVASSIIKQLRLEEMERYGLVAPAQKESRVAARRPAPVVAEPVREVVEEIDDNPVDPYAPQGMAAIADIEIDPDGDGLDVITTPQEPTPQEEAPRIATARLVDTVNNRTHLLQASPLNAGRSNDNNIVVADINASRSHARFTRRGTAWQVEDLGSKNGTQVNGRSIQDPVTLHEGDRITMGLTDYVFTTV